MLCLLHGITYQIMNVYLTTLRTWNKSRYAFVLKTFRSDKVLCVVLSAVGHTHSNRATPTPVAGAESAIMLLDVMPVLCAVCIV